MCPLRVYELPELSSFRKLERNQSRYTRGQSLRVAFSSRKSHLLCSSLGHCYSGSALAPGLLIVAPNNPFSATCSAKTLKSSFWQNQILGMLDVADPIAI